MLVTILFTRNSGDPATALTLTNIDLFLWRRRKSDGLVQQQWNGKHPTEEIGGGLYTREYEYENAVVYDYFASAQYTGAVVLDSDWALLANYAWMKEFPGDIAFTYTLTDQRTGDPIGGAEIWISTDQAGAHVIWKGTTDTFGVARDTYDQVPLLDAGQYYVFRRRSGWQFSNPDPELVA